MVIQKKETIRLDRDTAIPIFKLKLIHGLATLIENSSDRQEFFKFCNRVEYAIRAWYFVQFDDMMHLYSLFEPSRGALKLKERGLTEEEIDELELKFLAYVFEMMDKSNFKTVSNEEMELAMSESYSVDLPIEVDETKLDSQLLRRYFAKNPHHNPPYFADKYILFRRGFGMDHMTGYFFTSKIDAIISRIWQGFLRLTGIRRLLERRRRSRYVVNNEEQPAAIAFIDEEEEDNHGDEPDLYVERIRIQNMKLSLGQLLSKTTIQEPTFERIIMLYRLHPSLGDSRAIYVKHFKNIPMADMEIVLPEKKNPGLTPLDWVKFLVSAVIGLVTVITQLTKAEANIIVLGTIGFAVIAYCAKTYFTFDTNLKEYQNLITRTMYDKQLDSGRGTLLHLCDDVIQQEVKEVIISFFVLKKYGKFTSQDLDRKCEELILEVFKESFRFDVNDAITKLEILGLATKDEDQRYSCVDVTKANDIIGTTTEEVVTKAKEDSQ